MDLQDPKVQRLLAASVLSGLVLYLFFGTSLANFTYKSRSAQIATLETEHDKLSRELERARLTVGNMAKLEREFEYLHRQWKVAQKLLPEENEISGLLRRVAAAGTQSGLEFVRFEPRPVLSHGFYSENPVHVEVEGTYHQVGSFISAMSNLNRIINVRNMHLTGVKPEDQAKPEINYSVEATMEVVAYSIDPSATVDTLVPDTGTGDQELASSQPKHDNIKTIKGKLAKSRAETEASSR